MSFSIRNISAFIASLNPAQRRYFLELEEERAAATQQAMNFLTDVVARRREAAVIDGDEGLARVIDWHNPWERLRQLRAGFATVNDRPSGDERADPDGFTVDLDEVHAWARRVCIALHEPRYNDPLLREMRMLRGQARSVARYCQRNQKDPRSETILKALAIVTLPEAPSTNTMAQAMFGGRWGWLKRELNGM